MLSVMIEKKINFGLRFYPLCFITSESIDINIYKHAFFILLASKTLRMAIRWIFKEICQLRFKMISLLVGVTKPIVRTRYSESPTLRVLLTSPLASIWTVIPFVGSVATVLFVMFFQVWNMSNIGTCKSFDLSNRQLIQKEIS